MQIETANFGKIEIAEEKILTFVEEILGFGDYCKFTIIDSLDDEVFYWLQSIDNPELVFTMISPSLFIADYQVDLTPALENKLELKNPEDIIIYTLVVFSEKGDYISTNLKAPIIINSNNKKAGQLVLEKDYPTRYYLFKKEAAV